MIYTGRVKKQKNGFETMDLDQDFLSWARTNSENRTDPRSISEKRNKIKSKVSNLDITKRLSLSSRVDHILSQSQNFDFDILDLSRETNRNEMLV